MNRVGLGLIAIMLWFAPPSWGQQIAVPVEVQVPLFLKILSFDRNLEKRAGDELVIGIVYQRKFRTSLNVRDKLISVVGASSRIIAKDLPVRFVSVALGDGTGLDTAVTKHQLDVLYITPLRAVKIEKITAVSRAQHILTLAAVADDVESGLSVGIGTRGGKPRIIINLKAAQAEGVDFSSQLLKLAKVIR